MPANYFTIVETFLSEIEIKKSRFITYLIPIDREEEVSEHIGQIKKQHYKANHHCSAYILTPNASIQRMNDDGEPSGTAGIPMLEVLKKQELTNILAVVVRYFGGTKLGTGGLIRAYSTAVSEALKEAMILQNISQMLVSLTLGYGQVDTFQYFLTQRDLPITIIDTQYSDKVEYLLAINIEAVGDIHEKLIALFSGQLQWEERGEQTINIPI